MKKRELVVPICLHVGTWQKNHCIVGHPNWPECNVKCPGYTELNVPFAVKRAVLWRKNSKAG